MKKLLTILFFLFILVGCNMTESQQEEVKNLQTAYDTAVKDTLADTLYLSTPYNDPAYLSDVTKYEYMFYTDGNYVNVYVKDEHGFMKDSKGDSVEILQMHVYAIDKDTNHINWSSLIFKNMESYKYDVKSTSPQYTINCYNNRLPFDGFRNGVYRMYAYAESTKQYQVILLTLKPRKG